MKKGSAGLSNKTLYAKAARLPNKSLKLALENAQLKQNNDGQLLSGNHAGFFEARQGYMSLVKYSELIEDGISLDIFNYQGLEPEFADLYSTFEERFESLFDSYAEAYGLENCFFYIENDLRCNASASKRNKYNIISITNGYPVLMSRHFTEELFESAVLVALVNDEVISNAFCDLIETPEFSLSQFMMDCSIAFTFHHEFRHILQFNSSKVHKDYDFRENLVKTTYSLKCHTWEFDADWIAAFEIIKYTFSTYRSIGRTDDAILKCMLYLGLGSIFITKNLFYFNVMNSLHVNPSSNTNKFYTAKNSHPHPLVRMMYILEYFVVCVGDDFPQLEFDTQEALNNVLAITKLYFNSRVANHDVMSELFGELTKHLDEANRYTQILYETAISDKAITTLLSWSGTNIPRTS